MKWELLFVAAMIALIILSGCSNSELTKNDEQEIKNLISNFKTAYNDDDVFTLKGTLMRHKINELFVGNNFASKEKLSDSTLIDFKKEIGYTSIDSLTYKAIDINIKNIGLEEFALVEVVINDEDILHRTTQFNIFKKAGAWKIAWINKPQILDKLPINEKIEIAQKTQLSLDSEFR